MTAKRYNIGFVVNDLASDYQRRIFEGVLDAAAAHGVGVVCLVGGAIGAPGAEAHQAELYNCVRAARLDGVVVVTGALSGVVPPSALRAFVRGFGPGPVCSVGVALEGLPSVTVDNDSGGRAAFRHLIEQAGRRKIAFIRGPRNNPEAEARYAVYRTLLEESHLPFDPDLVAEGNFDAATGRRAVTTFLDERHVAFDAVMAANDLIALGAMNALMERKVAVPQKVSIVGFDDIEGARFAVAPLTTVRQPLADLGRQAIECLMAQLAGAETDPCLVLPAELVTRDSTARPGTGADDEEDEEGSARTEAAALERHADEHARTISAALERIPDAAQLPQGWAQQLSRSFLNQLVRRHVGILRPLSFAQHLEALLLQLLEEAGDASTAHQLISVLRETALPLLEPYPTERARAEDHWHAARVMCSSLAQRYHVQRRLHLEYWRHAVQEVGAKLMRCRSWETLTAATQEHLPEAGIDTCYVFTFEPGPWCQPRVILDRGKLIEARSLAPFPSGELLPQALRRPDEASRLLAYTLYDEHGAMGYVVFEVGNLEPSAYELLRDYLTGAVRGIAPAAVSQSVETRTEAAAHEV